MTSALVGVAMLAALVTIAPRAAAQGLGSLAGEVRGIDGKPFADVTVVIKNHESGVTNTVKTDKNGRYVQIGLRAGIYDLSFQVYDKDGKLLAAYEMNTRVNSGEEAKADVNFKDVAAKQSAEQIEARKKQEEERVKFEGMKTHFEAGMAAMTEAKQVKDELMKLPAEQRAPSKEKLDSLYVTAIGEFDASQKAAPEKDPNLHMIYYNQALAYDNSGKTDEAIAAYQKAIELRPTQAAYYNSLGNVYARAGKISEAQQAYQKSAELDPANAAMAYQNLGIVLFQSGRAKEAVEPLRKASELDPKKPQVWYLLGAALVGSMDFKKEGDNMVPVLQPGTVAAYQKCIELDPNGSFGAQAKAGLEQLNAMGLGISTKVKTTTTKKKP
jgi:tetratricopeptide (TPR) repeat protein